MLKTPYSSKNILNYEGHKHSKIQIKNHSLKSQKALIDQLKYFCILIERDFKEMLILSTDAFDHLANSITYYSSPSPSLFFLGLPLFFGGPVASFIERDDLDGGVQ